MCLSTLQKVTQSDRPYTVTFVIASPTIPKSLSHPKPALKVICEELFQYNTNVSEWHSPCALYSNSRNERNAKSHPLALAKFLHKETGHAQETQISLQTELCMLILSVLYEAEFEVGGAKRGRRSPNFSLNPCKYWMKCQGKVEAKKKKKELHSALWNALCQFPAKRKSIFKELRDLISTISFATGLR